MKNGTLITGYEPGGIVARATSMLAAIGVSTWGDFAALCAAIWTLLLIGEWIWKKVLRPCFERRGWIRRQMRRATDQ
jgi:hypothetical protein